MDNHARGRHLIVTGFSHPSFSTALNDQDLLAKMLHKVIDLVDMKVLVPAQMIRVDLDPSRAESPDDCGGVTGTAVLSTSHVSIHTWPLHNRFSFDIYSCKDFDVEGVVNLLHDRIGMCGGEVISLERTPNTDLGKRIRWRTIS